METKLETLLNILEGSAHSRVIKLSIYHNNRNNYEEITISRPISTYELQDKILEFSTENIISILIYLENNIVIDTNLRDEFYINKYTEFIAMEGDTGANPFKTNILPEI